MKAVFFLFDDHLNKTCFLYKNPHAQIIACKPAELSDALAQIADYQKKGFHCAGYLAYEAGYALMNLPCPSLSTPLLEFYAFPDRQQLNPEELDLFLAKQQTCTSEPSFTLPMLSGVSHIQPEISFGKYKQALTRIAEGIAAGEFYQLNYTFPISFQVHGSIASLFAQLRMQQKVAYGVWLSLPEQDIVSLSPELFFKKNGNKLTCKPMKGTIIRGQTAEQDAINKNILQTDPKSRAENLMIVDLLRNDLSRVAEGFSVHVEDLFTVETYETLHQMTSTISCKVSPSLPFGSIISSLFPCGSITGAPKHAAMQMITQLEPTARTLYTGAIGFITPSNDMCMNVPIRTLQITKTGHGVMGIGSGIVADSDITAEWEECLLKARFLGQANTVFQLLEAFLLPAGASTPIHLERHMNRLKQTALTFGFAYEEQKIKHQIDRFCQKQTLIQGNGSHKIRLVYSYDGQVDISAAEIHPHSTKPVIGLENQFRTDPDNIFLYHKTTHRKMYDFLWQAGHEHGFYDVLLMNKDGLITEATRHNFFIRKEGHYYTPPVSNGLLGGIQRQILLESPQFHEKSLSVQDVMEADAYYVSNAVRSMVEVDLDLHAKTFLSKQVY